MDKKALQSSGENSDEDLTTVFLVTLSATIEAKYMQFVIQTNGLDENTASNNARKFLQTMLADTLPEEIQISDIFGPFHSTSSVNGLIRYSFSDIGKKDVINSFEQFQRYGWNLIILSLITYSIFRIFPHLGASFGERLNRLGLISQILGLLSLIPDFLGTNITKIDLLRVRISSDAQHLLYDLIHIAKCLVARP